METKELPALPFERKTKKYGMVTVMDILSTEQGGLVQIAEGDHMPFWCHAKDILGFEVR